MKERILYWTPRFLAIMFILIISLFSFDVFFEGYGFLETIGALLIHLVPTFLLIAVLLIAWRWPLAGGIIFVGLGLFFIIVMQSPRFISEIIITGPLFVIGILFILNKTMNIKRPIY